jgi:sec-independent protein translocase protein TatA
MWDAPWHWVILAAVVIALFGYRKLPDASRSLGRSLRIFKTEIKGMSEDDKARASTAETSASAAAATPPPETAAIEAPPAPPVSTPPVATPVATPTVTTPSDGTQPPAAG